MAANRPPQGLYESSGEPFWPSFRVGFLRSLSVAPDEVGLEDSEFLRRHAGYQLMLVVMMAILAAVICEIPSDLGGSLTLMIVACIVEIGVLVSAAWAFLRGTFLTPPVIPLLATLVVLMWSLASGNAHHYYWLFPLLVAISVLLPTSVGLLVGVVLALSLLAMRAVGLSQWPIGNDLVLLVTMMALLEVMRLMNRQSGKLADLAFKDPLTGAYNRRCLMPQVQRSLTDFERHRRMSTLLLLDIDHFKSINDYHGHAAGDRVLQSVVKHISERLGKVDMLFRLDGEEFVILLGGVANRAAAEIAKDLSITIKTLNVLPDREVTVSIGVCDVSQVRSTIDWLEQVDSAMYRAKQLGRDRVEVVRLSTAINSGELADTAGWR